MSTDTPEPAEWLDKELRKLGLSQNELSQNYPISQSGVSIFRSGKAGANICIELAKALRKDVRLLLAIQGHMSMPNEWELKDSEIAEVWTGLSRNNQDALLKYARFLWAHEQSTHLQDD